MTRPGTDSPTIRTGADCPTELTQPDAKYCDTHRGRHRGRPATYPWTPEKDAFLTAYYDGRRRGRARQIATRWGWPSWVIRKRARRLGLARPTPDPRPVRGAAPAAAVPTSRRAMTAAAQRALLVQLRVTGTLKGATDLLGLNRRTVYEWMRHDPGFQQQVREARAGSAFLPDAGG